SYSLGSIQISLTIGELISGVMFVIMAIVTISLAFTNQLNVHAGYQVDINIYLTKLGQALQGVVTLLPEAGWAAVFALGFIGLIIKAIQIFKKETYERKDNQSE
ncbi:MAG: hypothetical protein AAB817_02940, partial [Patescibacteria group bacterium]